MILAVGPDQAWAYYLTLGMVATVNPCGFAMLPAYLSYFLGLEGRGADEPRAGVAVAMRVAVAVAAGFLAVFAVAGAAVRLTSLPVYETVPWVSIVIGLALAVLGLAMLAGYEPSVRLPRLDRGGRERTVRSMFVFGVSYAITSIGCTMPLFLGAVAGTMTNDSIVDGILVFAVYGLGMTVVLLALTVAIALARTSIVRRLRQLQPHVHRISGGLVTLAGAYVAWYGWQSRGLGEGRVPDSNVTRVVSDWSTSVTSWIDSVGAVRITVVVAILLAGVLVGVRATRDAGDGGAPAPGDRPPAGPRRRRRRDPAPQG